MYSDDCKYINYSDSFVKICYYLLYIVPLRCEIFVFLFFYLFFFYLFLLLTLAFGILEVENFGSSHLVSERKVKREPWLLWNLLIRDRVSSTLEWVLRVIIDMSAYLLVNKNCFMLCWLIDWVVYEFWSNGGTPLSR